ncbi:MAG: hypothetical protein HY233_00630 [Acidobacteriales bacterium]|nr:hypothetical protein [Terriglobales bacterium]
MSTPAVSNVSIFQELQNFHHDRRADLRQLGSALQAGDLNAAQQAYDALASLGQGGPFSNSEPFSRTDRATNFDAIGQALQSGDLAGAQAAFASLQETFGRHHADGDHHLPAFIVNLGGSESAGETENVSDADSIHQQLQSFRAQRKAGLEQLGQALQSGDVNAAQQAFDALVTLGQNGPFRSSTPFRRADREQAFEAIGQALQNGDLAGAQQAFTALADTFGHHATQVGFGTLPPIIINLFGGPLPPVSGGNTPPTPAPGGTLPPTPVPIATLPPTPSPIGTLPPTPVPPPQGPPSTGGGPVGPPEIIINVGGSTTPSGNTPEIIVNLPNPSSTPEEVTINFGDHGSGGQLTIDVIQGQNGNPREEVSINFNQASFNYQLVLNLFDSVLNSPAQSSSLSLNA